jgi:hypothetical protein
MRPPPAAVERVSLRLLGDRGGACPRVGRQEAVRVVVGLESRDARREAAAALHLVNDPVLSVDDPADVGDVLFGLKGRVASLTSGLEVVPQLVTGLPRCRGTARATHTSAYRRFGAG